SNVTLEFWVKLDGIKSPETIIQPYGMYSGDVTFATDTVLTNTLQNISWSTGESGYSITVDPKTTPTIWVSNGVNKDTINFNNKCSNQSTLPNYIITNGLVAWYPFTGNANDYTNNKNNGTVNGATLTSDRFGNHNSAYSFDGVSNYIIVPDNTTLRVKNITISLWLKPKKSIGAILTKTQLNTSNGEQYTLGMDSTGVSNFEIKRNSNCVPGNGWQRCILNKNSLKFNNWQHIVVNYDGTNMNYYINNQLINTFKPIAGNIDSCINGSLNFGRFWSSKLGDNFYNGLLDDIRIYDRALNQGEISALYNENVCISNITVTDTLKISSISGINELPENFGLVKVYPNPTKDVINIVASNPSSNYSIQIVNNLGTVVYTGSLSNPSTQINLSTIGSKGLYFIKILNISNNVLETKKMVLE
ncbi:MAG: hypothetical protein RL308_2061, partial [Bacteroidota bacterium]